MPLIVQFVSTVYKQFRLLWPSLLYSRRTQWIHKQLLRRSFNGSQLVSSGHLERQLTILRPTLRPMEFDVLPNLVQLGAPVAPFGRTHHRGEIADGLVGLAVVPSIGTVLRPAPSTLLRPQLLITAKLMRSGRNTFCEPAKKNRGIAIPNLLHSVPHLSTALFENLISTNRSPR
jgi:hypothetical protein